MAALMEAAFDREVARALSRLGADPSALAVDALADPAGAARAIEARLVGEARESSQILRAAPELRPAPSAGYGPLPIEPVWVKIERGSAEAAITELCAREERGGGEGARRARVERVAILAEERPCCDAPSCKLVRTHASAWLELDSGVGEGEGGRRLLVAEAWDLASAKAVLAARAVAAPLARFLGVPLAEGGAGADVGAGTGTDAGTGTGTGTDAGTGAGAGADASANDGADGASGGGGGERGLLSAGVVARWAIRSEGDRIVLRDFASRGPRDAARRTLVIGLALLALAVALWILFAQRVRAGEQGLAIALGAMAALVSLTSYAFLGVGRFAARYAAESAPLAAMGRDRVIVAPWVSRSGAVDLRPEGRLGAAIPLGEVRGVSVRERDGRRVVELATDHGPIDALACERPEVADYLCRALRRSLDEVRHPGGGASARQRARAKAGAAA